MGVTPWGQEGLQGVAVSAWGPPALPIYAGTRLEGWSFSGQQRWLWYGLLRGRPSSHLSIPHPAKLGPLESQTHSVPPHPGPLVPGQPLQQPPWAWSGHWGTPVSGLLSAQQQLFLLWPQRILWAPLPRSWVPQDASIIPASVRTGPARGTRAHVPASPSHPQVLFFSCQLLSSLWPSAWPLRRLGGLPRGRRQGQEHQFQEGSVGGQGAAVEPQGVAAT